MSKINSDFIERYQLLYQKDPNSKVFAPLAEAYRKMGWHQEALELAKEGVGKHPHFAGGLVALGQILLDETYFEEAREHLARAVELSPENIRAHELLAECYLQLKQPKEALHCYKMLLFFNPNNRKAENAVKKLESLTADEYENDVFPANDTLFTEASTKKSSATPSISNIDRYLSLADAFIVRNDLESAQKTLQEAEHYLGPDPQIIKRMRIIQDKTRSTFTQEDSLPSIKSPIKNSRREWIRQEKIVYLQKIAKRIDDRRKSELEIG